MGSTRGVGIPGLLVAVLLATGGATPADQPRDGQTALPVLVGTLLSSPDQYSERAIMIRGVVAATTRAVFPNGRPYYTLAVAGGGASITVFSWDRPAVDRGQCVEVAGVFHTWRYNLHPVIESQRLTVLSSPARASASTSPGCRPIC